MSRAEQKPRTFRRILALVVLVAVGAAAWWLWSGRTQDTSGGFRTGAVERGDVRVVISATGTLRATTTVAVGSQVSGQVQSVAVDFNDRVTKGQAIAMLDPAPFRDKALDRAAEAYLLECAEDAPGHERIGGVVAPQFHCRPVQT